MLAPNEKETFYKKLPLPSKTGKYFLTIYTVYDNGCFEKKTIIPIEFKKSKDLKNAFRFSP